MSPQTVCCYIRSSACFVAGGVVFLGWHQLTAHGAVSPMLTAVAVGVVPTLGVAWLLLHVLADLRTEVAALRAERADAFAEMAAAAVAAVQEVDEADNVRSLYR